MGEAKALLTELEEEGRSGLCRTIILMHEEHEALMRWLCERGEVSPRHENDISHDDVMGCWSEAAEAIERGAHTTQNGDFPAFPLDVICL